MKIETGMYVKIIDKRATIAHYGFATPMEALIGKTDKVQHTLGDKGVAVGGWNWRIEDVVPVSTLQLSKEEKTQFSALLKG